jgi:molybdate transport system substrate-binding protein
MNRTFTCLRAVLSLVLLTATSDAASPTLHVAAAASLSDALKEISLAFEKKSGAKLELILGASSTLARQIESGAPVDVFISADLEKMKALEKKELIDITTKENQLSNSLVVVVPQNSALVFTTGADLAKSSVRKLALADPKAVPAGLYAKAWLEKIGQWQSVESKVIATENVRAALAAVESGNVEAGIVYKTDAAISQHVKIALEVPTNEAPAIIYPMAVIKNTMQRELALKYLDHLDAPESKAVFEKFGFIVLPENVASSSDRP